MELLVFLLLSPVIFAQSYKKSSDPNNEPFLPIFPVYPYSPKLLKRGTDRDVATPGAQDSFPQKQEMRDSYASTFGGNFPREPFNYNSFPKPPPPFSSPYTSSNFGQTPFGSSPFGPSPFGASTFGQNPFGSAPFNAASFNLNPYNAQNSYSGYQNAALSQPQQFSANAYPNFYQPPAFAPNFYNQYPASVPAQGADYNRNNDADDVNGDDRKGKKGGRYKESDNEDLNESQFTDGANYLSSNIKDLEGQSASLDYPSTAYIKPHQLEQFMRQTLIKLLAQNVAQESNHNQPSQSSQIQYPIYESNSNIQNSGQTTTSVPNIIAKTGLSYVVNPGVINKAVNQSPGQTQQTQAIIGNNPRYADSQYQKSSDLFPVMKTNRNQDPLQSPDYSDFAAKPFQPEQNFQTGDQEQNPKTSHKNQNLVTPTPQSSSYHFSNYQPTPVPESDQRNVDTISINFRNKQKG